jgi:hypothetical protein
VTATATLLRGSATGVSDLGTFDFELSMNRQ